ncbi:MAG: Gp138 family membrane-puncturing spike protein [Rickettsiales bacterium]
MRQITNPDIFSLIERGKRAASLALNAVNIGIINKYDESEQTAEIQIVIKKVENIDFSGVKTIKEHPLLLRCPVMTLFGGNSFISLPIKQGDSCIVLFNDRDIENWLLKGGMQVPNTNRAHDLSDAIAIVGIKDLQNSIAAIITNGIRIQFADNSKIDLTNDAIESIAALFTHNGDILVKGGLSITGTMKGLASGGLEIDSDITQANGKVLKAGNGATGTFDQVVVENGIVVGGT